MIIRRIMASFPYVLQGSVTKGFGRGAKDLGFPTANLPDEVVQLIPPEFKSGVYFGWASVDSGPPHKAVMSLGWNPYYNNTKRTFEVYMLHTFDSDFYNSHLKVLLSDYLREEKNFPSLDALKEAIADDIRLAKEKLQLPNYQPDPNFFGTQQ